MKRRHEQFVKDLLTSKIFPEFQCSKAEHGILNTKGSNCAKYPFVQYNTQTPRIFYLSSLQRKIDKKKRMFDN